MVARIAIYGYLLILAQALVAELTGKEEGNGLEPEELQSIQTDGENNTDTRFLTSVEEEDIILRYYNQKIKQVGLRIFSENATLSLTNWIKKAPLKLITHGWLSSENSNSVYAIKDAYLSKMNINVVTLDWSDPASWKLYPLPAYLTKQVGALAARLIDNLVRSKMVSVDNVHIIGHSLGSHVAGAAGAAVTEGKVYRITGLDPAGPGFEHLQLTDSILDKTDADFVDIIHTAAGVAGYFDAIGHVDFYPNGGTPVQPGCLLTIGCSHGRAYEYYADAVRNPHTYKAYRCDTWDNFKNGECNNASTTYMGDETPTTASGVYYLYTKSEAPFGMENS